MSSLSRSSVFSRLTEPDPVKPVTNIYPRSDTGDRYSTRHVLFSAGLTRQRALVPQGWAQTEERLDLSSLVTAVNRCVRSTAEFILRIGYTIAVVCKSRRRTRDFIGRDTLRTPDANVSRGVENGFA